MILRFDDGSDVVVFQEPRQDAYARESVTIRGGQFSRSVIQALTNQRRILRIENEDAAEWPLVCKDGFPEQRRATPGTTEHELLCPPTPGTRVVLNGARPKERLTIRIVDSPPAVAP